jgi:rubredoxin
MKFTRAPIGFQCPQCGHTRIDEIRDDGELLGWNCPVCHLDTYPIRGNAGAQLVNLTPHEIRLVPEAGGEVVVPPSGEVARCAVERRLVGHLLCDGVTVPLHRTVFGAVEGLPAPRAGVVCIVSALVAQAAKRPDVVSIDDAVRDPQGRIVGARALARHDAGGGAS